jgi:hypothetical protein
MEPDASERLPDSGLRRPFASALDAPAPEKPAADRTTPDPASTPELRSNRPVGKKPIVCVPTDDPMPTNVVAER